MSCPNCNAALSGTPKFCPKCGAKIEARTSEPPATKKCPQCGSENAPAAKFCKVDGYRFESDTPASAVPAVAPRQEASPVVVAAVASEPPATKKCPQCGSENAPAAKFCKVDGYRFDSGTPASAVPATAPRQEPSLAAVEAATGKASDPVTTLASEKATALEPQPMNPPPSPPPSPSPSPSPSPAPAPAIANLVICPKCGTANAAAAKFCKKDGVALAGGADSVGLADAATKKTNIARAEGLPLPPILVTEPPPAQLQQAATPIRGAKPASSRSNIVIATGIVAVLVAAGGGGYWYLTGRNAPTKAFGEAPPTSPASLAPAASIQATPTRQMVDAGVTMILADAGFSKTIQSTTDADLVVTLYGSVTSEEQRARVVALAKAATGVAAVNDRLDVAQAAPLARSGPNDAPIVQAAPPAPSFDASGVQQDLNRQLRNSGLSGVSVKVNADRSAVLRGKVGTAKEKEDAQILASNSPELSGVRNTIQVIAEPPQTAATIDPAKLEGEINRALRNGGVGSVTAQVADDLSVTLKGSVTSAEQKDRAFQVVRRFQARGMPKDRIFVVE